MCQNVYRQEEQAGEREGEGEGEEGADPCHLSANNRRLRSFAVS